MSREMPRGVMYKERCSWAEMPRADDLSRGRCPEEMSRGERPRGDDLSRERCPEEMSQGEMRRGDDLSRGEMSRGNVPGRDAQGR